ncbi:MAG: glycoside hydrolase family 32 protein [Planctomycetota bacterium]
MSGAGVLHAAEARTDRVVEDFESESYGQWRATGDAFGDGPATGTLRGQRPVSGFGGERLVNTFLNGDGATGTLTSPEFTLDRNYLTFLIGGGNHDQTCLQLLVDGQVVATASGMNKEQLSPGHFDLSSYQGKQARLRIVDRATGGWGHVNVDDIVLSDTKPAIPFAARTATFTVDRPYLILPIKNGAQKVIVEVKVAGQAVRRYQTELATDPEQVDWYAYFTIEQYEGQDLTVHAARATEEAFALIRQSDQYPGQDLNYDEELRPQLRFSQRVGWINDPNGMVYHDGEWHLFFQHNPVGWRWGNMTWGHAVSKDLIHWEQLPNVLFPKTMLRGDAFSGGGTNDPMNTAAWKTGENDVLVVFYTDTGLGECVAYSNDNGRTFTQYEGNPIIKHSGRDPKAVWYAYDEDDTPLNERAEELGGHWVLFVFSQNESHGRHTAFYTSTNLKDWELASRLAGYYECPELFELPIRGREGESRWVTFAADAAYAIGTFDGRTFTPEHEGKHRVHHGLYYASQTFDNAPDGRRIQIGFSKFERESDLPGMAFNKTFNYPHELTLRETPEGLRMFAEPIQELSTLRQQRHTTQDRVVSPETPVTLPVGGDLFEISATIEIGQATRVGLNVGGNTSVYDVGGGTLDGAPLRLIDGKVKIRLVVDRPMFEVIGNEGAVFITRRRHHTGQVDEIKVFAQGGEAKLLDLEVYELKSIWR